MTVRISLLLFTCLALSQTVLACPIPPPPGAGILSLDSPIPKTGDQKLLVIPVDFADQAGTITPQNLSLQFFGDWPTGSLAQYYNQVSYGAISYTGDVVGIKNGAVVKNDATATFLRLPQSKSYYTDNARGVNTSNFPHNLAGVYRDAADILISKGMDLSPYQDTNGKLRNVIIVFAGSSSVESGLSSDFQPTSYRLGYYYNSGKYQTGGYAFDEFTFCPEKARNAGATSVQAGIAICAHELGHGLGLPDLYDLSYTTSGVGYYDLMGYGVYTDASAQIPGSFAAPSKEELGWVTPTTVNAYEQRTVTLHPLSTTSEALKIIPNNGSESEYFLIENRQLSGYDSILSERSLCPGIYIWHVDRVSENQHLLSNTVNTKPSSGGPEHAAISLVEADGNNALTSTPISYGSCSDRWSVGSEFSDTTSPSAKLWDGSSSGITIKILAQSSTAQGTAYEIGINGSGVSPTPAPEPTTTPDPVATVSPTATPIGSTPSIGIKITGKTIGGLISGLTQVNSLVATLYKKSGSKFVPLKRTKTNAGGAFSFSKIAKGSYYVKIGKVKSNTLVVH